MKKLILAFTTILLLNACSSKNDTLIKQDENEQETIHDDIIGTWKFIQKKSEETINDCDLQDTYIFKKDNSYNFDDYNTNNGSCKKDEKKSRKGYWKNNKNNTYNIKIQGYEGNGADLNIIFSDDKQELTFSNNGFTYRKSASI